MLDGRDGMGCGWCIGVAVVMFRFDIVVGWDRGKGEGDKRWNLAEKRGKVGIERKVTGQMFETRVERGPGIGELAGLLTILALGWCENPAGGSIDIEGEALKVCHEGERMLKA